MNLLWKTKLITRYVREVFPLVETELEKWHEKASNCQDDLLKLQAKDSIKRKAFHAKGGSIYALYPGVNTTSLVSFIVSLQTISDYLDNLCDRAGIFDEKAFRQLHLAFSDALTTDTPCHKNYYEFYPYQNDGGYLDSLVGNCRRQIKESMPSYQKVEKDILDFARLYIDLQSLKHLHPGCRDEKLMNWAEKFHEGELYPWEFSAAAGSTLGIFILAASANQRDLSVKEVENIKKAYFPWVTGLHILLDYLIDLEEDEQDNELNFIFYYKDLPQCAERLKLFLINSLKEVGRLPNNTFHKIVIKGLLAMYLSDQKASYGQKTQIIGQLLMIGGWDTRLLFQVCSFLRSRSKL